MNTLFLKQADDLVVSLLRPFVTLHGKRARRFAAQRGFSLIEISIVTTLMMLIAIIGIPAIQR